MIGPTQTRDKLFTVKSALADVCDSETLAVIRHGTSSDVDTLDRVSERVDELSVLDEELSAAERVISDVALDVNERIVNLGLGGIRADVLEVRSALDRVRFGLKSVLEGKSSKTRYAADGYSVINAPVSAAKEAHRRSTSAMNAIDEYVKIALSDDLLPDTVYDTYTELGFIVKNAESITSSYHSDALDNVRFILAKYESLEGLDDLRALSVSELRALRVAVEDCDDALLALKACADPYDDYDASAIMRRLEQFIDAVIELRRQICVV